MKNREKQKAPLALYIHIPFCVQKCLYCDFLSASAPAAEQKIYIEKLLEELAYWKEILQESYYIQTIFIGGGTPTGLEPQLLLRLGKSVRDFLGDTVEFTVEANPGTVTKEHIEVFRQMGISRISLGLQSAQDKELKALGRLHDYAGFLRTYDRLRDSGFDNINIDLMQDIPEQTVRSYEETLSKVISLTPEHISSYSLIVEEGTPFYQLQQEGKLQLPDEDTDREMYRMTQEMLSCAGYHRYEISNYAKPGKECRHNLTYWRMEEYLGLGLGAASYFQGYRFSNETDRSRYNLLPVEKLRAERHFVTPKEEMEEYVFLGLRMQEGISRRAFDKRFQVDFNEQYRNVLSSLFEKSLLAEDKNHDRIYLTDRGIDVSNVVLAEFLLDD